MCISGTNLTYNLSQPTYEEHFKGYYMMERTHSYLLLSESLKIADQAPLVIKIGSWKHDLQSWEDEADVEMTGVENLYSHLDQGNYIIGRL